MTRQRWRMKIGDVVKLKSGGPAMTVMSVDDEGLVVRWHDANGRMEGASLPADCLERAQPPSPAEIYAVPARTERLEA